MRMEMHVSRFSASPQGIECQGVKAVALCQQLRSGFAAAEGGGRQCCGASACSGLQEGARLLRRCAATQQEERSASTVALDCQKCSVASVTKPRHHRRYGCTRATNIFCNVGRHQCFAK